MAKNFISGGLRLRVEYQDRGDQYRVRLCPVSEPRDCETQYVRNPSAGPRSRHGKLLAVDDPRAMRDAAHAAISFASDDVQQHAAGNRRGTGWFLRPTRRRR